MTANPETPAASAACARPPEHGAGGLPRGRLWALGLLVFLTVGYFQNDQPGWNVNSQFALTCALAERGTARIDAYHERRDMETGDKAFFQGHYYSDKSPVTAFLGVPAFWIYRHFTWWLHRPFSYDQARYWTTWWTIGPAAAAFVMLLALLLARRGVAPSWALVMAGLWWLATPLLGYSILFFNYLPACALALGGWLAVEPAWRSSADRPPPGRRILLGGVLWGLAAWTLNTMALPAIIVMMGLLAGVLGSCRRGDIGHNLMKILRAGVPWIAGGALGVAGYHIYNYSIFGSFASPYVYEADPFFRAHMTHGLMGAGWPRPLVAWLVTFHPFQGLFLWFPVTLAALLGLLSRWRPGARAPRAERLESSLALYIFIGLLIYLSGYFMWWGGWSYAPRHLIPTLPWLALGLVPWLTARRRAWRVTLLTLAAAGAIFNLTAVAYDPQIPPGLPQEVLLHPEIVAHWPIPLFKSQQAVWLHGQTAPNWGTALHGHGAWSLLPLVLVWIVVLVWLMRKPRVGRY